MNSKLPKPNTTNSDGIDMYNWLEDRFLRFIGSSDSLFGEEIHDLLQRTSTELEALIASKVREARIDELEYCKKYMISTSPFIEQILQPRIDELESKQSKQEGK